MSFWRPSPVIRTKVLALIWRGPALLLGPVCDDRSILVGLRPLGGTIEFGETREEALRRELREELGCEASFDGPWHTIENIFVHGDATGHEYLFAINTALADPDLYTRKHVLYHDGSGRQIARWAKPDELPPGVNLYPSGLAAALSARLQPRPSI
ncbi:NUDIX hydrolase [Sphingomonas aerophila]|uniref:8-oxo-dGTP pyrophosphatase MutT (NUDIX family) n=1 Tax=Sphingomonas aerophila TaxID=1344948 RepID=A0A7W9EU22_9SPHN|nr:NUDIX domain-containing protein [Sphingomonas aerophila]MBB5714814.1 8-oxo-dGTP pyrophosphatase MutT (NUDIX family) [Sphingomonas aerophila]